MARTRSVAALALALAVAALAGCQVDVDSGAPRAEPTPDEVAAAQLAPNGEPTAPLAFSDPTALVTSPDGAAVALREGPDLTYHVVAELADGAEVVPTGTGGASPSGAWIEVRVGDATGFLPATAVALP